MNLSTVLFGMVDVPVRTCRVRTPKNPDHRTPTVQSKKQAKPGRVPGFCKGLTCMHWTHIHPSIRQSTSVTSDIHPSPFPFVSRPGRGGRKPTHASISSSFASCRTQTVLHRLPSNGRRGQTHMLAEKRILRSTRQRYTGQRPAASAEALRPHLPQEGTARALLSSICPYFLAGFLRPRHASTSRVVREMIRWP
jgi:hypothetical protein